MIDDFEGKVIAGKYRIDSFLAETEMGDIYRGSHIVMDKPVTIKILAPALAIDQRLVDRFLAEAKATSRVEHASILRVQDFGTDRREITYCVYENADGETLANLLTRDNELPVGEALDIACQTASGLAAANGNGVVHGNLTPGKILVSKDDGPTTVKVFDLGAETVGKSSDASIEYRAPETYDGGKSDERGDVYSLGVLIYQMLSGVVAFAGKTAGELKDKQTSGPPPPLSAFRPDLPPDLEPMILSAIAADPERRYQTMSAFAEDLELLSRGVVKPSTAVASVAGT